MRQRINKIASKVTRARHITKERGLLETGIVTLQALQRRRQRTTRTPNIKKQIHFLAKYSDIIKAEWFLKPYIPNLEKKDGPFAINWVMSPPGKGSGGHQNIFRFIKFLEDNGHTCHVYLYSSFDFPTIEAVREVLAESYPKTKAKISWYKGAMAPSDAVFATGWETAYPVLNDATLARRFYFVQDFEPFFYPMGSEYILAENTYRFNFYGITAGGWLAKKLSSDYGMKCSNYDFGADTSLYRFENELPRKEIFFYARPVTARRGFELGVMALERFHRQHPDYKIIMAGWDVSDYSLPFPYENLKSLPLDKLSRVYNRCAAGLVISLTNMSLLPLELLACGTIPVVTDGENNRQVSNNEFIAYAPASPDALAEALHMVVTRKNASEYARVASQSVTDNTWELAGNKFLSAITKELHG